MRPRWADLDDEDEDEEADQGHDAEAEEDAKLHGKDAARVPETREVAKLRDVKAAQYRDAVERCTSNWSKR